MQIFNKGIVAVLALLLAGCGDSKPPSRALGGKNDLQGHRGARGLRPENTLPAFEYAMAVGATTLELDTFLSYGSNLLYK